MPPEFRKEEHHLHRLRVAELSGLVFGTFSDEVEDLETYLGPLVISGVRRVLNRPARIIGRSTQILPNNWKLYAENVKDTYHASILHAFLTTFRINRLSQPGSINIDDSGGNHFSQAKMDYAAEDAEYKAAQLRSDTDMKLADNSIIDPIDEYGDQVSVQILTVFPNMVLQQIRNTIAVRVLRPRGVDKSELDWIHLGFADDDEDMTERRLGHGNLVGPAGYIALEDGCVGGFVQRALQYNDDDAAIVISSARRRSAASRMALPRSAPIFSPCASCTTATASSSRPAAISTRSPSQRCRSVLSSALSSSTAARSTRFWCSRSDSTALPRRLP